jgi:hypothetical protein
VLNGYGWCVLRAEAPSEGLALEPDPDVCDDVMDCRDRRLWADFRLWMEACGDPWITWTLSEDSNNDRGVLTFSVSRNHRSSAVWAMLGWIASNGRGSYGLFGVHDDEDVARDAASDRDMGDFSNRFRVHRVLHGVVTEMDDPFFGDVRPLPD